MIVPVKIHAAKETCIVRQQRVNAHDVSAVCIAPRKVIVYVLIRQRQEFAIRASASFELAFVAQRRLPVVAADRLIAAFLRRFAVPASREHILTPAKERTKQRDLVA